MIHWKVLHNEINLTLNTRGWEVVKLQSSRLLVGTIYCDKRQSMIKSMIFKIRNSNKLPQIFHQHFVRYSVVCCTFIRFNFPPWDNVMRTCYTFFELNFLLLTYRIVWCILCIYRVRLIENHIKGCLCGIGFTKMLLAQKNK